MVMNMMNMRELINQMLKLTNKKVHVYHMQGSSQFLAEDYGYDSWIAYWSEFTKRPKPTSKYCCPSCRQMKDNIIGGHVIRLDSKECFITPICLECNSRAARDENFRQIPFLVQYRDLVKFVPKK